MGEIQRMGHQWNRVDSLFDFGPSENTDQLVDYTQEFQKVFESKDEHKISTFFRDPGTNRHLQGQSLKQFAR